MLIIDGNKVFINHGIYEYDAFDRDDITYRNIDKYFPLPLKFRDILKNYYFRWFYINKTIEYHNRKVKMSGLIKGKVEFTIAHCPTGLDITVITLCYPFEDQFSRKEGVKWVRKRMKYALRNPQRKVWWKHTLSE